MHWIETRGSYRCYEHCPVIRPCIATDENPSVHSQPRNEGRKDCKNDQSCHVPFAYDDVSIRRGLRWKRFHERKCSAGGPKRNARKGKYMLRSIAALQLNICTMLNAILMLPIDQASCRVYKYKGGQKFKEQSPLHDAQDIRHCQPCH